MATNRPMAEALMWARQSLKPALLVLGLVTAGWALRDLPVHDFAAHARRMGSISFVLLGAAACAVGLPRQIVSFAGGYTHGVWAGSLLALLAQVAGCLVDVAWARLVAREWVRARLSGRAGERLARLDALLGREPLRATLTLRLLPVGNNLALNLLAGGFGVRIVPFVAGSAIGYLPQTAVFALLGSGVQVARSTEILVAIASLIVSIALGMLLLRRMNQHHATTKNTRQP